MRHGMGILPLKVFKREREHNVKSLKPRLTGGRQGNIIEFAAEATEVIRAHAGARRIFGGRFLCPENAIHGCAFGV
jgi:hypothetical protein